MDRFDYKVAEGLEYVSSGKTPGAIKRPVAWGSTSSFSTTYSTEVAKGLVQLIVEPAVDDTVVITYDDIRITYLQNGVYLVECDGNITRVVANTGPVVIKFASTDAESYVVVDGITVQYAKEIVEPIAVTVSPTGGVFYDKFVYGSEDSIDELIDRSIGLSNGSDGCLMPISRDHLFEPKLVTSDEMNMVNGYYVSSRKLTLANTAVAFYSNTDLIEKSTDGIEWLPVDKVEYHGEHALIFRSKDPSFALRYYDTNMTEFILSGATTATTGQVYKVGSHIGSYFSHDCYRIHEGSISITAEGLTSVTIIGYLPNTVVSALNPTIDYNGSNNGKIHLYTFEATGTIELIADEIYVSAIGVNIDHFDTLNHIAGVSEISYADEIDNLQIGQAINGDNEYAILDLQWDI